MPHFPLTPPSSLRTSSALPTFFHSTPLHTEFLTYESYSVPSLPFLTMENVNVAELVERLGSDEDAVRKMAVFKLQGNIGDPSFADLFIAEGGLTRLKYLTLNASGNTLAYSLTSFSRLLDVDKGWECVDVELVERVSECAAAAAA